MLLRLYLGKDQIVKQHKDIILLFEKYLVDRCTVEELDVLLKYFDEEESSAVLRDRIEAELARYVQMSENDRRAEAIRNRVEVTLHKRFNPSAVLSIGRRRLYRWLPYAAAVLLAFLSGLFWYINSSKPVEPQLMTSYDNDVAPGGNRAVLTLADGRSITLDEAQSGIVIGGEGDITYTDGSTVGVAGEQFHSMLSLTTPNGGTYQVVLPDGSTVWLNAGSTLRYPAQFSGEERIVELEGEAYFDIKELFSIGHVEKIPFKVISKGQEVEVLGTSFNVSAYADMNDIRTTLVEGKVKVYHPVSARSKLLVPGQQSVVNKSDIEVFKVDTEPFVAWKSGMFHFKNTPFTDMMSQAARWYNIEVVYKGRVPSETFGGRIRRDVSLSTFLELLSASEIEYHIKENQLIIKY